MPKPTFLNLAPEKRERFVLAAVEEFANHGYDHASISRLVSGLGIAKGSVYQYFDDKFDLFYWLIQETGRRKLEVVGAVPHGGPVLERLRAMYALGLKWQRDEPTWSRLGLRMMDPTKEPRLAELRRWRTHGAQQFTRALIEEGVAQGEFRSDMDIDTVAWLVSGALAEGLLNAYLMRLGLEVDDFASLQPGPPDHADEAIAEVVDAAITFLSRALGA